MTHTEQPDPIATTHRPTWEIVQERVQNMIDRLACDGVPTPYHNELMRQAKERDAVGRARYGVPLTPFNGRDSMKDAIEEALDQAVYLQNDAIEHPSIRATMRAATALNFALNLIMDSMEAPLGLESQQDCGTFYPASDGVMRR